MSELARQLFGDDLPPKRLALVVDLDDTVCTGFALATLIEAAQGFRVEEVP